jgi:hypothetical protein
MDSKGALPRHFRHLESDQRGKVQAGQDVRNNLHIPAMTEEENGEI